MVRHIGGFQPLWIEHQPAIYMVGSVGVRHNGRGDCCIVFRPCVACKVKVAPLGHQVFETGVERYRKGFVDAAFAGHHTDTARHGILSIGLLHKIPEGVSGKHPFLAFQPRKITIILAVDQGGHAFIEFFIPGTAQIGSQSAGKPARQIHQVGIAVLGTHFGPRYSLRNQ